MKDDFHDFSDEAAGGAELEARIVAWVLGEASAFEAAELERRCAEDPALRDFERRMREVHGLIGGDFAVKPEEDWRLPEGKREKVTDLLGVEAESARREKTAGHFARRVLLAAAACVALMLVAWPVFMTQGRKVAGAAPAMPGHMESPMAREWFAEGAVPEEARQKEMVRELRNAVRMQEAKVRDREETLAGEVRKAGDGDSPATEALADSRDLLARLTRRLTAAEATAGVGQGAASNRGLSPNTVDLTADAQVELRMAGKIEGFADIGTPLPAPVAPSSPGVPAQEAAWSGMEGLSASGIQSRGSGSDGGASDAFIAPAEAAPAIAGLGGFRRDLTSGFSTQARSQGDHFAGRSKAAKTQGKAPAASQEAGLAGNDFDLSRMSELTKEAGLPGGDLDAYTGFQYRVGGRGGNGGSAGNEFSDLSQMSELAQELVGAKDAKAGESRMELPVIGRLFDGERDAGAGESGTIRTNAALAFEHTENVDEVRRTLYLAEGNYNLGKFDDAKREYENVIRIDPYNKAARRGLERLAVARADYYRAAYDHTRAELLAQVDNAWELSVPRDEAAIKDRLLEDFRRQEDVIVEKRKKLREITGWGSMSYLGAMDEMTKPLVENGVGRELYREAQKELEEEQKKLGALKAALEEIETEKPSEKARLHLQQETETATEAFSTFSLHVSDASFRMARAAMERGERPVAEGVRVEEFYNAFDYGDPAPAGGEPVACAVEQAAHPALPQRNLVRIGVRTGAQGRGASTPLNLTLLLDSSGSMEREDRREGLARAVEGLAGLLKEGDTVTVASFARQPRLLADRLPGSEAGKLAGIVGGTPSEGGTNLEEGLKLAGELALRQFKAGAQNRIVLFTDGAANLGDAEPESLQAMVEGFRRRGIAFDAAGFGAEGLNDGLLERLTRNGNGRYYVVDGPEDAEGGFAAKLAGAFRPAAEDVKVQVRFNAERVARYRLIGFEEHRLEKEDFRDDSVDAAEMAEEEAGNALYQIEVLPQGVWAR